MVEYIQLLLHPTERRMAIRPCQKTDTHSISWHPDVTKTLVTKTISCPHFANALYQIMEWNPDFAYRIRGTWASRGRDEIIVFSLQNAEPAAFLEDAEAVKRRRRTTLCPDEWQDSFGDEFYEYALDNSFFFLAPRRDWNARAASIPAPGMTTVSVLSDSEILERIDTLREKVD